MANELHFVEENGQYVSEPLTGGDKCCVGFQLLFDNPGAQVIVEYCVFEDMGWKMKSSEIANVIHPDVVGGVPDGVKIRIRTTKMPTQAKYKQI